MPDLSRRLPKSLAVLVPLALLVGSGPFSAAKEHAFRLIAHPGVEGHQIARATVSAIFLKTSTRWADGARITPVDQSVRSGVRAAFTLDVHERTLVEIQMLWQRQIVAGIQPPLVKASDEEVITFVSKTQGAIGYISADTPVPETVQTLDMVD